MRQLALREPPAWTLLIGRAGGGGGAQMRRRSLAVACEEVARAAAKQVLAPRGRASP